MPKETFFNLNGEKQEKVMRSAVREFLQHGFENGNIGDIAKNAGVAKGSIYQYFKNKKELFLFSVQWTIQVLFQKYNKFTDFNTKEINLFNFIYQSAEEMWSQFREERELVIFLQDVFLGRFSTLTDESMAYIMKASDEHVLKMIKDGKNNGYIRSDIDDHILCLFTTGVSIKIKEYLMKKARAAGEDLIDEDFSVFEREIKAMIDLLKNGMGA